MSRRTLEEGQALALASVFNGHPPAPHLAVELFRFVNGKVHLPIPSFGTLEAKWDTALLEHESRDGIDREALTSLDASLLAGREILREYAC